MKKFFILTTIVLFFVNAAQACEICGCSHGNYYIGLFPQFKHKFIGVRYQYSRFNTVMADDPSQFSKDYFRTVELWGGWNIGKKWQVIAILPFNFIHQVSDDGTTDRQGLGDIAAMVNYKVFDKTSALSASGKLRQQFWLGAGIKLPTGKFNIDATDPAIVALANTQTGTASTDFILNGIYNVQVNNLGINTGISYKINTANNDKYSFGNKFSARTFFSYKANAGSLAVIPNIGFQYENTAINKLNKEEIAQTGGSLFTGAAGLELNFNAVTISANVQLPISQHFASGQTEMKTRGMIHLTFGF